MIFSRVSRRFSGRPDASGTPEMAAASAATWVARPGSSVRLALREWRERPLLAPVLAYAAELAILLAIGAGFGWMGPFGTYAALGTPDRFAFWMLSMPLVGVPASLAIHVVMASRALAPVLWPARVALAALVAALPGVLIVRALVEMFHLSLGGGFGTLLGGYLSVAVMIAGIGLWITSLIGRRRAPAPISPPAEPLAAPLAAPPARRAASPFLDRIPRHLGRNLLRIETEDHYLRVHTDRGHDLVLFRLADALAELDPDLGQQVHRSHWVARAAVAGVERDGARTTLRLADGACVPVSRGFVPVLRRAGWL